MAGVQEFEVGDISEWTQVAIPGDYSNAVTLIVTLRAEQVHTGSPGSPNACLYWAICDAIDADGWWRAIEDTNGQFVQSVGPSNTRPYEEKHKTARFMVPLAPDLAVRMWLGALPYANDQTTPEGVAQKAWHSSSSYATCESSPAPTATCRLQRCQCRRPARY